MLRPHEVAVEANDAGTAVITNMEFRGALVLHHVRLADGSTLRACVRTPCRRRANVTDEA